MSTVCRIRFARVFVCAIGCYSGACLYAHPLVGIFPRAEENQASLDLLGLALLFAVPATPGTVFDTLPVAGAVQWYRADTRATAGTDLLLTDRAGSGSALQAQTPGVPAVVESAINGRPALHFDGVDDRMFHLGTYVSTNMTATVVFKPEATGVQDIVLMGSLTAPGTHAALLIRNAGSYEVGCGGCGADLVSGYTVSTGIWTIFTITYDSSDIFIFINGATGATGKRTLNAGSGSANDGLYLAWNSTASFFAGDIAEVILYDRALNTADRTAVECSVAGRYALVATGC
jgi:hypothetical protein